MVYLKSKHEIELIRESSRIVADVLKLVGSHIRPGGTTLELDKLAEDFIRSCGGVPAFKGYGHDRNNLFPATLCVSVDNEVVHGIPSRRRLKEGSIVSIDVGVKKDGYFGDGAWSFAVGEVNDERRRLLKVTEEALMQGIAQVKEGNRVHDISHAVQRHVESRGFSVVRELVGHGVGKHLHEEPNVPNYGKPGTGMLLKNGMTLAIEPMVNAGAFEVFVAEDGWTVQTQDGLPSAHFEHTIAIVDGESDILTMS